MLAVYQPETADQAPWTDVTADPVVAGREIRRLAVGDPVLWAWGTAFVSDGVVVTPGTTLTAGTTLLGDLCPDGAYTVTADGVTPIATADPRAASDGAVNVFPARSVDGSVVVETTGGCSGDAVASTLQAVDLGTGAVRPLLSLPADDHGVGGSTWWLSGPASRVLGR